MGDQKSRQRKTHDVTLTPFVLIRTESPAHRLNCAKRKLGIEQMMRTHKAERPPRGFPGLFERHLDVTPLHGRTRGLVRCIFHEDRLASLSVDLDAGVFNCFGCGLQGGMKRFAELVGDVPVAAVRPTIAPATPWLLAMSIAQRQPWFREGVCEVYAISDWIRLERRRIAQVRGGAKESDWDALTAAADAERILEAVEAEFDELMQGWRL